MLDEKTLFALTEMMLEYVVDYLGVKHTKEELLMNAIQDKCRGYEVGADDVYEKLLETLVSIANAHKKDLENMDGYQRKMNILVDYLQGEHERGIIVAEAVDRAVEIVRSTLPIEMRWKRIKEFADANQGLLFDEVTSEEIAEILED